MSGGVHKSLNRLQRNLGITPALAALAYKLYRAKGALVAESELAADSHGTDPGLIKVQVFNLRGHLAPDAIENRRGYGYRLTPSGFVQIRVALITKAVRAWQDDEEDITLRKLWADPTLSVDDVAEAMGRTRDAIRGRANGLRLPRKAAQRAEMLAERGTYQTPVDDSAYVASLRALGGFRVLPVDYERLRVRAPA